MEADLILSGVSMTRATVKMALKNTEPGEAACRRLIMGPVLLLGVGVVLSGCMPDGDLPMLPPPTSTTYQLGAGDQVRVITFDVPQLTNTFTVGDDGTIAFPLVGSVEAAGQTSKGLASEISSELIHKSLMPNPSVSVEIAQYRPISVLGEVNHPGQYPYQPGLTMLGAVALAGGFTYRAVTSYATDIRPEGPAGSGSGTIKGRIEGDTRLEPGDVVTILERYF
jgi:polysaccharide export outer membrane protein